MTGVDYPKNGQKFSDKIKPILNLIRMTLGATKRCRLCWMTNSALVYEPKCGAGWGGGGDCGVSSNENSCAHKCGGRGEFQGLSQWVRLCIWMRGEGGICRVSANDYSCLPGAQINLGDPNSISKLWYDRRGLSEAHGEPRLRLQDQHGADEAGLHAAGPVQADRTGISNTGPVGLPLGFLLPPGGLFLDR